MAPKTSSPPLVPLRIPACWTVIYNNFREVVPTPDETDSEMLKNWEYFTEDLLQIRNSVTPTVDEASQSQSSLIVDVGWYPEGHPCGTYRAVLVRNSHWDSPLSIVESTSWSEIQKKVEEWMDMELAQAEPD